jgi:hypothetical protein
MSKQDRFNQSTFIYSIVSNEFGKVCVMCLVALVGLKLEFCSLTNHSPLVTICITISNALFIYGYCMLLVCLRKQHTPVDL